MSIQWGSPLKAYNFLTYFQEEPKAKRRLDFDELENQDPVDIPVDVKQEPTYTTLLQVYGIDFMHLAPGGNHLQLIALREQLLSIENFIYSHDLPFDSADLRLRIASLLKQKDHEKKMGELGMILFYLDRDKKLPETDSFIQFRALEMKEKVTDYIKKHNEACKNSFIPSGKTHYLMRAFAHMLFTTNQTYNRGGLFALKLLLTNPAYAIAHYLQPEHQEHILLVIEQLLASFAFDGLFKKTITVHRDLQDAIRLNLKLPPKTTITSLHACYDCMLSLFSDIRQIQGINCYAVSSLIYVTENSVYKSLSRLIEWLESGHFIVNEKIKIPIAPILAKRISHNNELAFQLESQKALTLAPIAHISHILDLPSQPAEQETTSLGNILLKLFQTNHKEQHIFCGEQLFYSYKHNLLNHLQLAMLEFATMNLADPLSLQNSSPYSDTKTALLDYCLYGLNVTQGPMPPSFRACLHQKLGEKLWLESCDHQNIKKVGTSLRVGNLRIDGFRGDSNDLADVLHNSLRLFALHAGKYCMLSKISDLQYIVKEAILETQQELSVFDPYAELITEHTLKALQSENFKMVVASFAASQMNKKGILGKHLHESDLLLLHQKGGAAYSPLHIVYQITPLAHELKQCQRPIDLLEKISAALAPMKDELITIAKIMLLSETEKEGHAWTHFPSAWQPLLNHKNDFSQHMQDKVFSPAAFRLAEPIPNAIAERIIKRFSVFDPAIVNKLPKQKYLSYRAFRNHLLDVANKDSMKQLHAIIEEEFSAISLSKEELITLCDQLNVTLSTDACNTILSRLPPSPTPIYLLGALLRHVLIQEKCSIIETHRLMHALEKVKKMPLSTDMGDLNYTDNYEDHYHPHWIIAYSWIHERLCNFTLVHAKLRIDPIEFINFCILYPRISKSRI